MDVKQFPESTISDSRSEFSEKGIVSVPWCIDGDPLIPIEQLTSLSQRTLAAMLSADSEIQYDKQTSTITSPINLSTINTRQLQDIMNSGKNILNLLPQHIGRDVNTIGLLLLKWALGQDSITGYDVLSRLHGELNAKSLDYKFSTFIVSCVRKTQRSKDHIDMLMQIYDNLFPEPMSIEQVDICMLDLLINFPGFLLRRSFTDSAGTRITDTETLMKLWQTHIYESAQQPSFFADFDEKKSMAIHEVLRSDQVVEILSRYKGPVSFHLLKYIVDSKLKELFSITDGVNPRDPISFESLVNEPLKGKAGPYLFEVIHNFPINKSSIRHINGDVVRAALHKTGSRTDVYIKFEDDSVQIVFRNSDIGSSSIEAYKQAARLLPGYVSHPIYMELEADTSDASKQTRSRDGSFVEVFAGPALADLNLDLLPPSISRSILLQKIHILAELRRHNIDHGHTHNHNFNVRFLLQDGDRKEIFFDVNVAIQYAVKHKMSLTPIVTLRDWDHGSSPITT